MIKYILKLIFLSNLFFENSSFMLNNVISKYNHKKYTLNYNKYNKICIMKHRYNINININETEYKENLPSEYYKNNIDIDKDNSIDNINNNTVNNTDNNANNNANNNTNNINDINDINNKKFLEEYHKNNTVYYSFDNKNTKDNNTDNFNYLKLDEIKKYINERKNIENKNFKKEKYLYIDPSSKDLKLLNNVITYEWAKNWIYDMVHYTNTFPTFMYQDMFLIKDFANANSSKQYFYIGYFPSDIRCIHGPYYIGAFELIPKMRELNTHLLVQNPNYMIENEYDENKIVEFKRELIKMSQDAFVFFKFSKLKKGSNDRYYYSWLYEDI